MTMTLNPNECKCGRQLRLLNEHSDTPKCVGCGRLSEWCICTGDKPAGMDLPNPGGEPGGEPGPITAAMLQDPSALRNAINYRIVHEVNRQADDEVFKP